MAAYQCPVCGYVYGEVKGDAREGFSAGTRWEKIPDDWNCPDCAVREKFDFEKNLVKIEMGGQPIA
ncbi:rubredoxin [Mycobacterium sp.]|uniref:rubredoxin n=1 Tax=Mycobacterium sp. TaxID=1785 RepID=UPI003BAAABAD